MAENKFFSSPSVDIIESSTKIVGDIYSKADFRIDGIVEGNITTTVATAIIATNIIIDKHNEDAIKRILIFKPINKPNPPKI